MPDKVTIFNKLAMLLLALYPIMSYYAGPFGLSYANIITIALVAFLLIKKNNNSIVVYPKGYLFFWFYTSLVLIFTASSIKITFFIPGGISFFLWSLTFGLVLKYFNFKVFKKYLHIVFFISSVVLISQEIITLFFGTRFIAFLPLNENLTIGVNYSEWKQELLVANRSSSIFAEPSNFALYSLPILAIELFYENDRSKFLTPFSIYVIAVLLILRSGLGMISILILLFIRLCVFLRSTTFKKNVLFLFFLIPVFLFATRLYIASEIGEQMLERTSEFSKENSSAYLRMVRGFLVFDYLPTNNKLLGIWPDDLLNMNIPNVEFSGKRSSDLYFNGLQTVLIRSGIMGTIVMCFFFINIYRKNILLSKVLIWIFLFLSLMDQTYMSSTMLIFTTITSHFYIKGKDEYEKT